MHIGVAGAGLTGAVIARRLAEAGHTVVVHDRRNHIGGNCHTERHALHDVMIHRYGPHVFHTSNERVWRYVNDHAEMVPFRLEVRSVAQGGVYQLPVNLATINQAFGTAMGPNEARAFIAGQVEQYTRDPVTFEQAALATVGRRLYELLFEGYTTKQWGCHPSQIPASVFRRLPVRFNYDASYFDHRWQAVPRGGYTQLTASILDHRSIRVELGSDCPRDGYEWTVWTGPLDAYFDHRHGRLGYRTLSFVDVASVGDYQGTPILNYPDLDVAWTRVTEHAHFAPWETHEHSVASIEYSRAAAPGDEPFYPIRSADDVAMLHDYLEATRDTRATFAGRLGTYRYLDMDVTIAEALDCADRIVEALYLDGSIPSFTHQETTWPNR